MSEDPKIFYEAQIQKLDKMLLKDKKFLNGMSVLRVSIFLLTILLMYRFFGSSWFWIVGLSGTGLFLVLLRIFAERKAVYDLNQELKSLNEEEIGILTGNYRDRWDGKQFENGSHVFSSDIDLFGKGSFFQYINRTGLKEGTAYFVELMLSNDITSIQERQSAIQELSALPEWVQKYTAIARLTRTETNTNTIVDWLKQYKPYIPISMRNLPLAFGMVSVLLTVFSIIEIISFLWLGSWFLLGLILTSFFLKRNNDLNLKTSKAKDTIQQYALLLDEIEQGVFTSAVLVDEKENIKSGKKKASQIFKIFSDALERFDNRNNLLVALFGNGFFLWDIHSAAYVEKWIVENGGLVEQWFKTVAFFNAYNTLATFSFNHPEFSYPEILKDPGVLINAESIGHPLIQSKERVTSDLSLGQNDFFVITGANMAGKSTFLRTVSLFVLMSNLGLPVCARQSRYYPIKLITSMRTSDSLADQSSYFFSELSRLQLIIEQLEKDTYLVVLDEILKGTNSVDKAAGSKKLIERLVQMQVAGIIATHDLSLCSLAEELPSVKNYFFETEINNDELHFDYQLKAGVCKNMNASFLLEKMKIIS